MRQRFPPHLAPDLRVLGLVAQIQGLLPTKPSLPPDQVTTVDLWKRSLSFVAAELERPDGDRTNLQRLVALLSELKDAETSAAAGGSSADVCTVLGRLGRADDIGELFTSAPSWIARVGFDRVLISTIDDHVWVPQAMYVRNNPTWGEEIIQAGRDEPTVLDGHVVESRVARVSATMVVTEVQTNPHVHRSIARVSRSDNYGVVPIEHDGSVVAMLHADCYFQGRQVTSAQVAVLQILAQGFSAAWKRISIEQHLLQFSTLVPRPDAASAFADTGPSISWVRSRGRQRGETQLLTRRETEVIRLMANGETNYQIARRLGVAEETTKSHVKHIFAKFDAANRAEAVARWLEQDGRR